MDRRLPARNGVRTFTSRCERTRCRDSGYAESPTERPSQYSSSDGATGFRGKGVFPADRAATSGQRSSPRGVLKKRVLKL